MTLEMNARVLIYTYDKGHYYSKAYLYTYVNDYQCGLSYIYILSMIFYH